MEGVGDIAGVKKCMLRASGSTVHRTMGVPSHIQYLLYLAGTLDRPGNRAAAENSLYLAVQFHSNDHPCRTVDPRAICMVHGI